MNPYAVHAGSLSSLQQEQGDDCPVAVFSGVTIKILPGGVRQRKDNSPGGFSLDSDLQLTCLSADFPEPPRAKQTLVYLGRSYRIETVTTMAGGLQLRLNANDANQKL